jgi:hypothetical protein
MGWSVSSGNDGQFAPELGGQFDRIFHPNRQSQITDIKKII